MKLKINERIKNIKPYVPGKPEETLKRELGVNKIIKLASNENPLGVSQKALKTIKNEYKKLHYYPDDTYYTLKQKIKKYYSVKPGNIIFGAGSSELIKMSASVVLSAKKKCMISKNSFLMYPKAVQEFAGKENIIWINTNDDYSYDLDTFLKTIKENNNISLIFIANPNNPTGTYVNKTILYKFLKKVPEDILVVLDEAYVEYVDAKDFKSGIQWFKDFSNLIILRTFSKAHGLAGLRIAFGISNEKIIKNLLKVRLPFNVSRIASAAATGAIDDKEFLELSYKTNLKGKKYIYEELVKIGFKVIKSQTNFLMFIPDVDPESLVNELEKKGIIIRPLNAFGINEAVRVTIGTMEQNKIFIENLKNIVRKIRKEG